MGCGCTEALKCTNQRNIWMTMMWPCLRKNKMWTYTDLRIYSLNGISFNYKSTYLVYIPFLVTPYFWPPQRIPQSSLVSWYHLTWEFAPSRGIPIFPFPLALSVLPERSSYFSNWSLWRSSYCNNVLISCVSGECHINVFLAFKLHLKSQN